MNANIPHIKYTQNIETFFPPTYMYVYINTTCIVKGHIKFDPLFFKYSLSTICVIRNEGLYPFFECGRSEQKDDNIKDVL